MQPSAVVEDLDVLGDSEAGAGSGGPVLPVVHLVLQRGEEALGGGVVQCGQVLLIPMLGSGLSG